MDELTEHIPAGIMNIGPDKRIPARLTKRFEPKTWKPVYDMYVFHHVMGKSNIWIAQEYKKTPQLICNVLRSMQGQVRIKVIAINLQTMREQTIESRMGTVADKFMKRIEAVVEDDELFEKAPFAFVDRGLAIIKGLGKMNGDPSSNPNGGSPAVHNTQNNFAGPVAILSEKAITDLKEAIAFSTEARALHESKLLLGSGDTPDNKDKAIVGEIKQSKAS